MLFPEGGFLRKRKAVSQNYARKNNLPHLDNVSLPRVGALQAIMSTVGPQSTTRNNNSTVANSKSEMFLFEIQYLFFLKDIAEAPKICWILDITIAYPNGDPLGLLDILFGNRPPCRTSFFYRLFHISELPQDQEALTQWLFNRWEEKDKILDVFYKTGNFPVDEFATNAVQPNVVAQDYLRFLILHVFFITSTLMHVRMFIAAYQYYHSLMY